MEILQIIWRINLATVRDVHAEIIKVRNIGYTTILKQMQIMYNKGLLDRNTDHRQHLYSPIHEPMCVQIKAIEHLILTVFDGSAPKMLSLALNHIKLQLDELSELKRLIKKQKQDRKQSD